MRVVICQRLSAATRVVNCPPGDRQCAITDGRIAIDGQCAGVECGSSAVSVASGKHERAVPIFRKAVGRACNIAAYGEIAGQHVQYSGRIHGNRAGSQVQIARATKCKVCIPVL